MTQASPTRTAQSHAIVVPGLWALLNRDALRRAGLVALVLGSVLTFANQFEAVFGSQEIRILPMALVYLTPFVVVTISQVLGIRQARVDASRQEMRGGTKVSFLTTSISHGIPARAVRVGLIIGSLNSAIVGAVALVQHGLLDTVPLALIGQAFSLPILFGMLSQAIAYRRAVTANGRTRTAQPVTRRQFTQ